MEDQTKQPEQAQPQDAPLSLVERAEKAAAEIKAQNDRHEQLVRQAEENRLKSLLGGQTNSGQSQPQKSPEEIKKEGAAEFFKGSPIEKAIKKYG